MKAKTMKAKTMKAKTMKAKTMKANNRPTHLATSNPRWPSINPWFTSLMLCHPFDAVAA
jgi:hypothetical protein